MAQEGKAPSDLACHLCIVPFLYLDAKRTQRYKIPHAAGHPAAEMPGPASLTLLGWNLVKSPALLDCSSHDLPVQCRDSRSRDALPRDRGSRGSRGGGGVALRNGRGPPLPGGPRAMPYGPPDGPGARAPPMRGPPLPGPMGGHGGFPGGGGCPSLHSTAYSDIERPGSAYKTTPPCLMLFVKLRMLLPTRNCDQ